jgi:Mg/Co/Ni transporter MgtE
MKKTITSLNNLVEVPESTLRQVADYIPQEEESGIRRVLKAAEEYRAANMTPIFILDQQNMDVLVVCKETFGKRLH